MKYYNVLIALISTILLCYICNRFLNSKLEPVYIYFFNLIVLELNEK